jgi:SAM-dependent methyltransferase
MDARIYERMAEVEERHWWFASRREILEKILSQIGLPKDSAILEVGCGTGGNFPLLAQYGSVHAMEPFEQARAAANSRGMAKVTAGSLPDDIPFAGKSFDLILMTDVLEHLDDDVASLAALRRRLKPGGWLLVTVPALSWMWSEHDVIHHHRRRYHATRLREMVGTAGFQVRYVSYFNFLLFPVIAATRVIERVIGAGSEGHDLRMPSAPMNSLLKTVFASERHLLGSWSAPFGVSLMVLAQTPSTANGANPRCTTDKQGLRS